jgi:hypothetical protein
MIGEKITRLSIVALIIIVGASGLTWLLSHHPLMTQTLIWTAGALFVGVAIYKEFKKK